MNVKRGAGGTLAATERKGRQRGAASGSRLHRTIWYMGAKARVIPDFLDGVIADEVPAGRTVVDLMSGTGVVAAHLAERYRVFAGDVQEYAQTIARSLIEHDPEQKAAFLAAVAPDRDLGRAYAENFAALRDRAPRSLAREADLLERSSGAGADADWCRGYRQFIEVTTGASEVIATRREAPRPRSAVASEMARLASSIELCRRQPAHRPFCLATVYYSNVYFGLAQAMELDSLRAAIDALDPRQPFAGEKRVHYLSALVHAASLSTSGTSHFAQPRHLRKDSELRAMAARRTASVWDRFREFSREILATVAAIRHRAGNRVLAGEYCDHLRRIDGRGAAEDPSGWRFEFPRRPQLIYLDPPYTADNYSRFYHVLEVLVRYDYPPLATNALGELLRGRYPEIARRFRSGFCRAASVESEFRRVVAGAAAAGAKLVISYASPTGLLLKRYRREAPRCDPVARLEELCRAAYADVRTERRGLMHSGQGDSNLSIEELLVVCRKPAR